MSGANAPSYSLPRHAEESSRLGAQHEYYTRNFGYLLHPTIARTIPENAIIADVGCGTGAWTIELAQSLPSVHIEGFDISDAQFPASYPQNCTLKTLNILEIVPPELESRYDVVHVRLLVCALKSQDWHTVASNAKKLLKPGGWLQWCESDFENLDVLQAQSGASRAAIVEMFDFVCKTSQKYGKWTGESKKLRQIIQETGFEQCTEDVVSSDRVPEVRFKISAIGHAAVISIAKGLVSTDPEGCGRSAGDVDELCQRANLEASDEKVYWRWNIHTVVGRKPGNRYRSRAVMPHILRV